MLDDAGPSNAEQGIGDDDDEKLHSDLEKWQYVQMMKPDKKSTTQSKIRAALSRSKTKGNP
jgi:hypothetical protein